MSDILLPVHIFFSMPLRPTCLCYLSPCPSVSIDPFFAAPLALRYISHIRGGSTLQSVQLWERLSALGGAFRCQHEGHAEGQKRHLWAKGQLSYSQLVILIFPGCWGWPSRIPTSCIFFEPAPFTRNPMDGQLTHLSMNILLLHPSSLKSS